MAWSVPPYDSALKPLSLLAAAKTWTASEWALLHPDHSETGGAAKICDERANSVSFRGHSKSEASTACMAAQRTLQR